MFDKCYKTLSSNTHHVKLAIVYKYENLLLTIMERNTISQIRFDEMNRERIEMLKDTKAHMEDNKDIFFDSYLME